MFRLLILDEAKMPAPIIKRGQRAIMAGRTGSGKSTWARWMLERSPGTWVILNPKHTDAYNGFESESIIVPTLAPAKVEPAMKRARFVVINPETWEADPDTLDAFITWLHNSWQNVGLCCDELYKLHKNGVAGQGLIGWLTRGRELKQSFLGLTQRPSWLSQFLFSESDYIGSMALNLPDDRKRMEKMTGKEAFSAKLDKRDWLWYNVDSDSLDYYGAVPIDPRL